MLVACDKGIHIACRTEKFNSILPANKPRPARHQWALDIGCWMLNVFYVPPVFTSLDSS
jgi:hypothetical protein